MATYPNNSRQAAQQDQGAMLHACGIDSNKESSTYELASGNGPIFGLDWQSCALLPTLYCMHDDDFALHNDFQSVILIFA